MFPLTVPMSKQLLPVYDKPMVYYPISILMLSGIKDILIISTPKDLPHFKNLLGSGEEIGVNFSYAEQPHPRGIADAFLVGEEFIGDDDVCLILGDNIIYGQGLKEKVQQAAENDDGATIFGYYVKDPERYGVVDFDHERNVLSIEEKPEVPKSNYAVIGLYYYNNDVVDIAKNIKPSDRGELEITDVNKEYLKRNQLKLVTLGRGIAWLDTGTHESLMEASNFIETIEKRQGLKIACLEEIAYRMGFIELEQLKECGMKIESSTYGRYILEMYELFKGKSKNE